MYKEALQNIDNIAIWPVVSFVIFFLFFICLLWWVFTTDKGFINKMSQLPFDDSSLNQDHPTYHSPVNNIIVKNSAQ
jgi:cbb3-type cytochrome oxidase subunit 3